MKTKTNQQSEPPAVAGGLTQPVTAADKEQGITPEDVTLNELQAENEQLKATIRLGEAHRQITGELTKAGARSPELLFDSVKADLQFAEDGNLENAVALIEKLKTGFPEQFGLERPAGSIDGGAGANQPPQLTKSALANMKPTEIAELDWNDVRRVLANG